MFNWKQPLYFYINLWFNFFYERCTWVIKIFCSYNRNFDKTLIVTPLFTMVFLMKRLISDTLVYWQKSVTKTTKCRISLHEEYKESSLYFNHFLDRFPPTLPQMHKLVKTTVYGLIKIFVTIPLTSEDP